MLKSVPPETRATKLGETIGNAKARSHVVVAPRPRFAILLVNQRGSELPVVQTGYLPQLRPR